MPITALNAVPYKLGEYFSDGQALSLIQSSLIARTISILLSVLIAVMVFSWSRSMYGASAALVSLLLYLFDPNLIAHSQIIGTDMYAWGTTLLVFFCSWKFAKDRTWKNGLLWALALGISSLAKYTTVILIPLSMLSIFIYDLPQFIQNYKDRPAASVKNMFGKYLGYLGLSVAVSILLINIGFLFNRSFMRFGEYEFYSHLLQGIQTRLPWLDNVPVPVPFPYMEGFDLTYYYSEEGLAFGNTYLLGELRDGTEGFDGYYIIVSFFKMPIAAQLIAAGAFYAYLSNRERRKKFFTDEVFLLLPISFFFLYFNFLFSINIGIRYYLVLFPLLYVFCGSLFNGWASFSKTQKITSAALIVFLVASTLSYFPNFIPYFNEFLPDRKMAYKILADSNIDYGQSEYKLKTFMAERPEAILNPTAPTAGMVIAGVNNLVGVFDGPEPHAWLRENFEPDDTIAYTYLVYEISQEEIDTLCQTTDYCK
ncbi:MAG: glycosyltransferase family 39 protein [Anaerolineales bacterium]|nr:glycosyltransferase family 39 protein [Anaerolineales bacterium]